MTTPSHRREFLQRLLALSVAGLASAAGCTSRPTPASPTASPVANSPAAAPVARTASPARAPGATPRPAASGTALSAIATPPAPALTGTLPATAPPSPTGTPAPAYLAVARGADADPAELTQKAITALGGIERFVKRGADVIVKPNICVAYNGPEYASTTNPEVVAAIVRLCLGAGARRVRVMDLPFGGTPQASYAKSGIADAVKAAGGEMEVMSKMKYQDVAIPAGKVLKKWQVYGEILSADVVINVPIAKNHEATRLTLGMKNLMGVVSDRNGMHARGLDQSIADLNSAVRPQLTVVDAIRILVANGPTGGNLKDVKRTDTIIASADVVAADSYAATLFGLKGSDISYVRAGSAMGLGQMDLKAVKVAEIAL